MIPGAAVLVQEFQVVQAIAVGRQRGRGSAIER
jgi:hypothetical protein